MKSKKNKSDLKAKSWKSKLSFDEEIITKNNIENVSLQTNNAHELENLPNTSKIKPKKKTRRGKPKHEAETIKIETTFGHTTGEDSNPNHLKRSIKTLKNKRKLKDVSTTVAVDANLDNTGESEKKKKRKLKQPSSEELNSKTQDEIQEELNPMHPTINTTDSLRKKKKQRHTELLDAKRVKTELNFQQKAINYLSKWKHSKDQWKFEKLTQVWIQNSIYDDSKLPDKIWTTVVEYFDSAKGKVRNDILNHAVKLYEEESKKANCNKIILTRAKSIVQSLSE